MRRLHFIFILLMAVPFTVDAQTLLSRNARRDTIAVFGIQQGETVYTVEELPFRFIDESSSSVFIDGVQYHKQNLDSAEELIEEEGDRIQYRYIPLQAKGKESDLQIYRHLEQSPNPFVISIAFDDYVCVGMKVKDIREMFPVEGEDITVLNRFLSVWCTVKTLPDIKKTFTNREFAMIIAYLEESKLLNAK